ncbi:hypothetical protein ACHWQZ_G002106 [Mnemiopsis leidyi]
MEIDFSISTLNKIEDDLNSELFLLFSNKSVSTVEDLNPTVIANKLNKNPLAKIVNDALKLMNSNLRICKSAAAKIDELKSEKLADKKALTECQQKQLDSFKSTVKTEMKTWSEIVKTIMGQNPSANVVKKIERSTVDQNEWNKIFIIHSATEKEYKRPEDILTDVFFDLNNHIDSASMRPQVVSVRRIGVQKSDKSVTRSIRVTLTNSDDVKSVLSRSNLLKKSPEEYFRKEYKEYKKY